MNHTPLINSKRAMILAATALACPFVQARTAGYITTSTAAGTSQVGPTAVYAAQPAATPAYTGGTQDSINAREAARRKAKTSEAMELLQQGRTAYAQKQYVQSLEKYEAAWKVVPKAPATQKLQEFLVKSIGDASIAVAMEYSRVGRYDEAEQLLLDVLERDPNNKQARHVLSQLRDPERNNPALTPEHVKNVEEVNRLLTLAFGYMDLGDYDAAYAEFNHVIKIDPYNVAARRGQESINNRRMNYYKSAHDSFRSKALAEVDALWEEQMPKVLITMQTDTGESVTTSEKVLRIREGLENIIFGNVDWEGMPMEDALDLIRKKASDSGMQINFIFDDSDVVVEPTPAPAAAEEEEEDEESEDEEGEDEESEDESVAPAAPTAVKEQYEPAIIKKLVLVNVKLSDLLAEMCRKTKCAYRVEDNGVKIFRQNSATGADMTRRQWIVRPSFFAPEGEDEEDEGDDDFSSGTKKGSSRAYTPQKVKAALIEMGVNFPRNASATYSRVTQTLTVVNTDANLEEVDAAIQTFRQSRDMMVKVSTKFIEISQTNEEELSFDWVINPFAIGGVAGRGDTFLGGVGAASSNPVRFVDDYVSKGGYPAAAVASKWPIDAAGKSIDRQSQIIDNVLDNGLMTGGLRSGSGAITSGALQNLIKSGSAGAATTATAAPGVMSLSGIYDRGSYQTIMRGLSQKKGVDIMSAPSLVIDGRREMEHAPQPDPLSSNPDTEDGCAKIEVIRRFVYPTEYDPPQIPENGGGDRETLPIAAPANPQQWGVEDVGVMLRFQVQELKDDECDIVRFRRFEIRVVDFEGFVNYGSPITTAVTENNNNDILEDLLPNIQFTTGEGANGGNNNTTTNQNAGTNFAFDGIKYAHVTLTENRIDMPIFSRRYINTNPCVYDGHTIAIGGMIQDEVQKVEDKVPVFGDLPFIGRFFRSNAESHIRKNLMIFVTADVIDPMGQPLRDSQSSGTSSNGTAAAVPGLFPDDGLVNP